MAYGSILWSVQAVVAHAAASPAGAALDASDRCGAAPRRAHPEAACYALGVGREARTVRIYAPAGAAQGPPLPLVVLLHGGGGTGAGMEWLTRGGFNRIADRDGALIAYPDGSGRSWNDGRPELAGRTHRDDLGFLVALPQAIAARWPLDAHRVYAAGISNGGLMSYRLGCAAAATYTALAAVAANLGAGLAVRCHPARPVPLAIVSGTEDPIMPWQGGAVRILGRSHGEVLSTAETARLWSRLSGCEDLEPLTGLVLRPDPDTSVRAQIAHCPGAELRLYEISGGGHTWPGGEPYLGRRLVGRVSQALDANEELWAFLRRWSL